MHAIWYLIVAKLTPDWWICCRNAGVKATITSDSLFEKVDKVSKRHQMSNNQQM